MPKRRSKRPSFRTAKEKRASRVDYVPSCVKPSGPSKLRWQSEKPLKFPCVTKKLSQEELEAISFDPYANFIDCEQVVPPPVTAKNSKKQENVSAQRHQKTSDLGCLKKLQVELEFSKKLAEKLGGKTEYANPAGRIDVLTSDFVIEVKVAHNWKHAIGQALVYSFYFPDHSPMVCLIGDDVYEYFDIAERHCGFLGIAFRTEGDFDE